MPLVVLGIGGQGLEKPRNGVFVRNDHVPKINSHRTNRLEIRDGRIFRPSQLAGPYRSLLGSATSDL